MSINDLKNRKESKCDEEKHKSLDKAYSRLLKSQCKYFLYVNNASTYISLFVYLSIYILSNPFL